MSMPRTQMTIAFKSSPPAKMIVLASASTIGQVLKQEGLTFAELPCASDDRTTKTVSVTVKLSEIAYYVLEELDTSGLMLPTQKGIVRPQ